MAKNRIQKSIKRPGAFKKFCWWNVTDSCIQQWMKSKDPTTRKRAILAKTLMKFRNKK